MVFVENKGDADGAYHPGFNEIALKRNLRLDQKRLKSVLIHEIQHAIQSIEGFADGASVRYWDEQRGNNRVNDDRSSRQLYRDTAGEVEARDVQSRMDMTAVERKNTRPDIDRTDVVFAENGSIALHLTEFEEEQLNKQSFYKKVNSTIAKIVSEKGRIDGSGKIVDIIQMSPRTAAMVNASSSGKIDISQKKIGLNPSDVWHEYKRHTVSSDEISRNQVAFTKRTFANAIKCIISPDIVETIFDGTSNPTQAQSFAYVKKAKNGNYVVVEAVGGKNNPNIYPVMILEFTKSKWNKMIRDGKTIGEIIFADDEKKLNALNISTNRKSRVFAAQFASYEAIANTPHSPRLNDSIRNDSEKIKMSDEKSFSARQEESYSTKSILIQLNADTVSQLDADGKKLLQSYQRMAKRADYYRNQIDQLRAEKNAWKGKSIHAGSVLNSALASKNAEINELQRKLENTEKIMAGQVRNPQIARLVNTARDQAVKQLRAEKNAKIAQIRQEKNAQIDRVRTQYQTSIANAREGRAVTELRGKIRKVAEDIKGRMTAPSDARYIPLGLAQSVIDLSGYSGLCTCGRYEGKSEI